MVALGAARANSPGGQDARNALRRSGRALPREERAAVGARPVEAPSERPEASQKFFHATRVIVQVGLNATHANPKISVRRAPATPAQGPTGPHQGRSSGGPSAGSSRGRCDHACASVRPPRSSSHLARDRRVRRPARRRGGRRRPLRTRAPCSIPTSAPALEGLFDDVASAVQSVTSTRTERGELGEFAPAPVVGRVSSRAPELARRRSEGLATVASIVSAWRAGALLQGVAAATNALHTLTNWPSCGSSCPAAGAVSARSPLRRGGGSQSPRAAASTPCGPDLADGVAGGDVLERARRWSRGAGVRARRAPEDVARPASRPRRGAAIARRRRRCLVGPHEPRTRDRKEAHKAEGGEAMKHVLAIGDVGDADVTASSAVAAEAPRARAARRPRRPYARPQGPAMWVQQSDGSWAIRWRNNDTWWDLSQRYLQSGKRYKRALQLPVRRLPRARPATDRDLHHGDRRDAPRGGAARSAPRRGPRRRQRAAVPQVRALRPGPHPGPGPSPGRRLAAGATYPVPGRAAAVEASRPAAVAASHRSRAAAVQAPSSSQRPARRGRQRLHWWLLGGLGLAVVTTIGAVVYHTARSSACAEARRAARMTATTFEFDPTSSADALDRDGARARRTRRARGRAVGTGRDGASHARRVSRGAGRRGAMDHARGRDAGDRQRRRRARPHRAGPRERADALPRGTRARAPDARTGPRLGRPNANALGGGTRTSRWGSRPSRSS